METSSTHFENLKILQFDFIKDHYSKIDKAIESFSWNDLNSDDLFEREKELLIKRFLIEKIKFSDPEIINHKKKEIVIGASFEYILPHKKEVFEIQIKQNFTGTKALFNYRTSNGFSYNSNYQKVFIPIEDSLFINTICNKIDKEEALIEFEKITELTHKLISYNNEYVDDF